MAVTYVTLYPPGGNSTQVQVVEGSQLHMIYADMGFSATPSAPGPPTRPDPFPQYVHDDEIGDLLADAAIPATDPVVAALVTNTGSATSGAMRAAFGTVVSVAAHGAVGDGATDDTAEVQAAATAAAGGTLYFPNTVGYYRLTSVTIPSNTRVLFDPDAGVQPLAGTPVLTATGAQNITVEGGRHSGGGYNLSGLGLFTFIDCVNVAVSGGVFAGMASNCAAILFEGTKHSTAHRNRIIGGGYGVIVGALSVNGSPTADHNVVSENTITDTVMDSIFVTSSLTSVASTNVCVGNKVLNNYVSGCGDAGIESGVNCRDTLISGNTVIGSAGPNILLRDNTNARVVGNHCYDSAGTGGTYGGGIAVLDQTAASSVVAISDNHCEGNAYAGINIGSSIASQMAVSDNVCVDNAGSGILVNGTKTGTITGNMCARNTAGGIDVWASGSNPGDYTITGNTCFNNGEGGIQTAGQDVVITGNRCFDDQATKTQEHGIWIGTTQGNYGLILGNDCRGNGDATADILVAGGTGTKVAYNQGRYTATGSA